MTLNTMQRRLLDRFLATPELCRTLLCIHRRAGTSWMLSRLLIEYVLRGEEIWVVGSGPACKEMDRLIREALHIECCPQSLHFVHCNSVDAQLPCRWEDKNVLVLDAQFVSPQLLRYVVEYSRGFIIQGTPLPQPTAFHNLVMSPPPAARVWMVPVSLNPDYPADYIQELREHTTDDIWESEWDFKLPSQCAGWVAGL